MSFDPDTTNYEPRDETPLSDREYFLANTQSESDRRLPDIVRRAAPWGWVPPVHDFGLDDGDDLVTGEHCDV